MRIEKDGELFECFISLSIVSNRKERESPSTVDFSNVLSSFVCSIIIFLFYGRPLYVCSFIGGFRLLSHSCVVPICKTGRISPATYGIRKCRRSSFIYRGNNRNLNRKRNNNGS